MTRSPLLGLYWVASACLGLFGPLILHWRANFGRENRERLGERLGRPSLDRPEGGVIWLPAANAAEVMALAPLVEKLGSVGYSVLVTTRDASAGSFFGLRPPPKSVHQFAPLDVPKFVARFLDHWRPDMVLIAGAGIWPNLIIETRRRAIPIALVNGRLSPRSFLLWRKIPGPIGALMSSVDLCMAQTAADAERFLAFGAKRVQATGNVIYDLAPPPVDAAALAEFVAKLGARPAWLAAATHPGEEEVVLEVHRRVARHFPDLLTIIAPRRAKREFDIALRAQQDGPPRDGFDSNRPQTGRRSWFRIRGRATDAMQGASVPPIARQDANDRSRDALANVHVASSIGEVGLFYRAVGVVFLGKSLCRGGGENPIFPAKLGCAILHGPDVGDYCDAYEALDAAGGAALVLDAESFASELALLLSDAAEQRAMARAAAETMGRLGGATKKIMLAIEPYLAQAMVAPTGARASFRNSL